MKTPTATPNWKRKRAAPRTATGWGKPITDDVVWTRLLSPAESYQVEYVDRHGEISERIIDVMKIGSIGDVDYLGVRHVGKFKTLRADGIRKVRQLTEGHAPSIFAFPGYDDQLPVFPIASAMYKMATIAVSTRRYTVDLNLYTCTCPEKRERVAKGYKPGQLGFVCPHMARAILENLPADAAWSPQLIKFLKDPRRVHIDNLT
jgi:hypothetical protein